MKAMKLELVIRSFSARVAEPFPVEVKLVDFSNNKAEASKDIELTLRDLAGEIDGQTEPRIRRGSDSVSLSLRFRHPGNQQIIVGSEDALLASTFVSVSDCLASEISSSSPKAYKDFADVLCCNSGSMAAPFVNKVSFHENEQLGEASSQAPSNENSKPAASPSGIVERKRQEGEIVVEPVIHVNPVRQLWANGKDEATVRISLNEIKGDQKWAYTTHEEIVFNLDLGDASFVPKQIRIPKGKSFSESPAILTSDQPISLPLSCIPERKYKGIAIHNPNPVKVEFIVPINAIGIDPQVASVQVNVSRPLDVYLWNDADPGKKKLAPTNPVGVQLQSEKGNGRVVETSFHLDDKEFSRLVGYVGQRLGDDTIVAVAHYSGLRLSTTIERQVKFPWSSFLAGLLGALIGSKLSTGRRFVAFVVGLMFCVIVILFPLGTTIPEVSSFIHPVLTFVLTLLISLTPDAVTGIRGLLKTAG